MTMARDNAPDCPKHRRVKWDPSAPHGRDPEPPEVDCTFLPGASSVMPTLARQATGYHGHRARPAVYRFCTMAADGTMAMHLVEYTPHGIGHAELFYLPDHDEYQPILRHVGPLKPGEVTSVPAWPRDRGPSPRDWPPTRPN